MLLKDVRALLACVLLVLMGLFVEGILICVWLSRLYEYLVPR